MLYLLSSKGKEMDVSIRPRPFANDLFRLVVFMLEEIISQVKCGFTSCFGLVNIEVNEDPGKVSPGVQLAYVNKQCIQLRTIGMDFLNAGPQYDYYKDSSYC